MRFHVFPEGVMCSIRRALMLWLVPMFLLVGIASAAFSYWTYSRMVGEFMDDQMEQLGQSIAAPAQPFVPDPPGEERVHKWGAFIVQVYGADGQIVANSWAALPAGTVREPGFATERRDGRRWRVYTSPPGNGGRTVQVLQSDKFRAHIAAERAGAAIAPVLILLPLSFFVLWGIARAMSRAIEDIGRETAKLDEHTLAELSLDRVPQEIQPLVQSFNSVLGRMRDAFSSQRRFVQDAAHELRTPITAIGLQLENLRKDLPAGTCSEQYAQLEAGVRRAQRLVDQLLKMTRQEWTAPDTANVDLQAQLRESINTLIALADQRNIDLGLVEDKPVGPVTLRCAPGDVRSLLDNLIENALRYTPEGGVVDVRVVQERGKPAIEVVDTGPGIPSELLPRVFDRFFRVPGSEAPGSGLGLSIAQAAAQRCGLKLTLRNRDDRSGLIARVEPA